MYLGILLKFCQIHGTLHHWTPQIPWQYLGSEIVQVHYFYHKILGRVKRYCVPLVQKLGGNVPHVPSETRSLLE